MCSPVLVVLKLGQDRIRNVWISLWFWSRHIFCDTFQTTFLSRKILSISVKVSQQRSKRMDGWIPASEHRHLGKERSCYKMCVASPSRARADPCPTLTAYTGKQREKKLLISKLDRPWAAGQFCVMHATTCLNYLSSSPERTGLIPVAFGAGAWAVLAPNNVLALMAERRLLQVRTTPGCMWAVGLLLKQNSGIFYFVAVHDWYNYSVLIVECELRLSTSL